MKVKCLGCGIVVEVTGKELEQKAAIFNIYNNSAADYLNLLSLTGGECTVVGGKLGNKHMFELEEGTESEIHNILISAGLAQTKIKEGFESKNKLVSEIERLKKELETANSTLQTCETAIPFAMDELNNQKNKFKEVTGIENIEKWK